MMGLLLTVVAFVLVFVLVSGVISLVRARRDRVEDVVRGRLQALGHARIKGDGSSLVRRSSAMSDVPWFNRLLMKLRLAASMRRLIMMADAKGTPGAYLLGSAVLFLVFAYLVHALTQSVLGALFLGSVAGSLPVMYLRRLKNRRMDKFTNQLPDALDLMTRALKAGHTFNGSMQMVATEFEDPIGVEFRQTLDEINYGKNPDTALSSLLDRVECPDLKFFVVSVNIQRETGGNLAEIISNIARLVRERFELYGKVRVLSAEGKLSAMILTALPFAIAVILYLINEEYMSLLFTTETGRTIAMISLSVMTLGVLTIRKMIRIKV
ncbi:type II secretion system F family protein [Salidesulfovibrio onnuriiensis]|uniref:type II secretion system F family protein n=1 Tax=Salidesulfovibrio onnuriiensis TaxID=2583823 RepID=UPI00202B1417|nr:type II secretion system F family protein [Salidesulfovibrio onnuriiensis]